MSGGPVWTRVGRSREQLTVKSGRRHWRGQVGDTKEEPVRRETVHSFQKEEEV